MDKKNAEEAGLSSGPSSMSSAIDAAMCAAVSAAMEVFEMFALWFCSSCWLAHFLWCFSVGVMHDNVQQSFVKCQMGPRHCVGQAD